MIKLRTITLASVLALAATSGIASATDYQKLRDDKRMHNELLGASIAYLIDESCSSLKLRKFRLLNKAFALRSHAVGLGYSTKEVLAYVDSKAEQDRFRAIAEPMLKKRGAKPGVEESYCAIGRENMEKGTFSGSLLTEG
ncbi:DUF5333 domain-containing protein [Aliiroseovarius sp. 2305UL8-7]|uniref:DUF5333 domain-containing protein n=1 Tax=Aliiroseovarius conchicola TaxID=3121637 RepID=UPI003526F49D